MSDASKKHSILHTSRFDKIESRKSPWNVGLITAIAGYECRVLISRGKNGFTKDAQELRQLETAAPYFLIYHFVPS